MNDRNWEEAIEQINTIPEEQRGFRVRHHLARAKYALGEVADSHKILLQLYEESPKDPWLQKDLIKYGIDHCEPQMVKESAKILFNFSDLSSHNDLQMALSTALFSTMPKGDAVKLLSERCPGFEHYVFRSLHDAGILSPNLNPAEIDNNQIPRKIFQYWDNPNPPKGVAACLSQWSSTYPDFQYELFNFETAVNFAYEHGLYSAAKALEIAKHPAHQADIFRLIYLFVEGGIYVDADEVPTGGLRQIVENCYSRHIFWMRTDRLDKHEDLYCTNWFIGAAPRSTIIANTLMQAVDNTFREPDNTDLMSLTGPYLLTRNIVRCHLYDFESSYFVSSDTGRRLICRNGKWSSEDFLKNRWQDLASSS